MTIMITQQKQVMMDKSKVEVYNCLPSLLSWASLQTIAAAKKQQGEPRSTAESRALIKARHAAQKSLLSFERKLLTSVRCTFLGC